QSVRHRDSCFQHQCEAFEEVAQVPAHEYWAIQRQALIEGFTRRSAITTRQCSNGEDQCAYQQEWIGNPPHVSEETERTANESRERLNEQSQREYERR